MRTLAIAVALLFTIATPAVAQRLKPLPHAAFDVRGFFSKLGQDPVTASDLDVAATDLPARGLGGVAGIHVYLWRGQNLALGIGAEGVLARGHRTPSVADTSTTTTSDTPVATAPRVEQRLAGLSGGFSLNFGHRDGWSYVSAGMGPLSFITFTGTTAPGERPPVQMTINLGGGARWFSSRHVAFCFDVRLYQTQPEVLTPSYPRRQRASLLVMSAGISLR